MIYLMEAVLKSCFSFINKKQLLSLQIKSEIKSEIKNTINRYNK